jgi:hypothetical protein
MTKKSQTDVDTGADTAADTGADTAADAGADAGTPLTLALLKKLGIAHSCE